jgi:hypothetical protein
MNNAGCCRNAVNIEVLSRKRVDGVSSLASRKSLSYPGYDTHKHTHTHTHTS